eukprot:5237261-Prymnesium_polylepis.1
MAEPEPAPTAAPAPAPTAVPEPAPTAALSEGMGNAELQRWMEAYSNVSGQAIFAAGAARLEH